MNTELKNAWCDALESNKYKQGTRRLRTRDEFCCLGVLCDVRDGIGIADDIQDTLIDMNDSGKTFSEIAAFIRESL